MSARPWFKFWPGDWLSDTGLQTCSIGARGLWVNMLAIMHSATPRGHLCRPNGEMITASALALLAHVPANDTRKLLAELRRANVFSITDDGVIFSRKMVRDETRIQKGRETGQLGGNPQITGKIVPIRGVGPLTEPLRVTLNPQWPLASPRKVSTSQGKALGEEEALGEEGPFTGGDAA